MRNRRRARRLLFLLCLSCLASGCQTFHGDQTIEVLVRDAETKQPIPSAEVYLCQRIKPDEVAPCRSVSFTQVDGIAQLHTEPSGEHGFQVQAVAQGYQRVMIDVPADARKNKASLPPSQKAAPHPVKVTVDVYTAPDFSVEFVLPPGYRGLIKAEVRIQDNLALPKGQRCFRFPVSASGDVLVQVPSLLRSVPPQEFQARYGDGPLLGATLDAEKVGFRWLKGVGSQHLYVAGNQVDYERVHRQVAPDETQAAFGAVEDINWAARSHKYKYGGMTAKNYDK
ncbi:MAG: hypothetical protein ACYC3I_28005 [Gemmataceae bacterium]